MIVAVVGSFDGCYLLTKRERAFRTTMEVVFSIFYAFLNKG